MKKILYVALSITFIILLLSACTSSTNNTVSYEKICQDLSQHESVINCFNSKYIPTNTFAFEKFEIIKRRFDDTARSDEITCYVYAKNEYLSVKFETKLVYNYYDEGGWILDELTVSQKEATPLRGPDINLAISAITTAFENEHQRREHWAKNDWQISGWLSSFIDHSLTNAGECFSYHIQDFQFGDFEVQDDFSTAMLNVKFKSSLTDVAGYFSFTFNAQTGWNWVRNARIDYDVPCFTIESIYVDYSEALGTFSGYNPAETKKEKLIIYSIENGTITLDLRGYRSLDFDALSGSFTFGSGVSEAYYYYNPIRKCWERVYPGTQRIYEIPRIS